jgi:hypothetical protein
MLVAGAAFVVSACADAAATENISEHFEATTSSAQSLNLRRDTVWLSAGQSSSIVLQRLRQSRVTWRSASPSVASVSNVGLVTALSAGSTEIMASSLQGTEVTTVGVKSVARPASGIRLSPDSAVVLPGGTFIWQAYQNQDTVALSSSSFVLRIESGTLTQQDMYLAPSQPGRYRVIASTLDGSSADTSFVIVKSPAASGPALPASSTPNLPTQEGLRSVLDTRFVGWRSGVQSPEGLYFYYDGRTVTDSTGPAGSSAFEMFYAGNDYGNGAGGAQILGPQSQRWKKMYFSILVWVPSNYSTHSNGEKFFYPILNDGTNTLSPYPTLWATVGGLGTESPAFGFQAPLRPGYAAYPQNGLGLVWKGRWNLIEYYLKMNSPNKSDGIWKVWANGVPAADFDNIQFSSSSTQVYFDGIRFTGARGGGVSTHATPPEGQVRRYNRLTFFASE